MSNESENNEEAAKGAQTVQDFLDHISGLDIRQKHKDWYLIDVLAILDGYNVEGYEVESTTGDSLIFLKKSLLHCSPELGVIRHYPKSLIHCFVEDCRAKESDDKYVFRGELFSVTPESEQLCWLRECLEVYEIPEAQVAIAEWMKWLNQ